MATEVELQRLLVSLEASFVKYERQWAKAQGFTDQQGRRLAQKFDGISSRIGASGEALGGVNFQTSNIAAQFQDIAVQLQAGQSPFTIALQQGTQLSAALGGAGGLRGALAALGSGFLSLVNPISLATIAAITLGGTAVQWLTQMGDGAEEVSEKLKAHRDYLKQVVSGYGAAEAAVEAYRQKASTLPEAEAAGDLGAKRVEAIASLNGALKELGGGLNTAIGRLEDFTDVPVAAGSEENYRALLRQRDALLEIKEAADSANPDLDAIVLALKEFLRADPAPMLADVAAKMLENAVNARDFKAEVGAIDVALRNLPSEVTVRLQVQMDGYTAAIERLKDLAPELRSAAEVARASARETLNAALGAAPGDIERQNALRQYQTTLAAINEEERRRNERTGRGSAAAAEREREAVREFIAELEFEATLIGQTEREKERLNALRRAGAAATAEERDEVERLTLANYDASEALRTQQQAMEDWKRIGLDAVTSVVNALKDGKIEGAEFVDIVFGALAAAANIALPGSGPIVQALGGLFKPQKRANGGPVTAGRPYVVGDGGRPELFVPSQSGVILPRVPTAARGGGREVIDIRLQDDSGRMADIANRQIVTASGALVRLSVENTRKAMPQLMADAQRRYF